MHYHPASQTPKSSNYRQSTVDIVSVAPSYSSWGTLPTPPPTTAPFKFVGSPVRSGPPLVHPLLQPPGHLLRYDIRCPPPPILEQAFNPSTTKAHVSVKGIRELSFFVENYNGITVHDVLGVLYGRLQRPMVYMDLSMLSPEAKELAHVCFHSRTSRDPNEYAQGMKFMDRLASRFCFAGITPSPTPGVWEVHFA